ncbi:MAG: hypothetical protein IT473_07800 [Lysobacter sp.]|nr:hypothetical protein [Lysobacter sp.]
MRDAGWIRQRRPLRALGETECRHVQRFQRSGVERCVVEVPPQFIALCERSGVRPQAALRGLAATVCGLRYDEHNRLQLLETAEPSPIR